MSGIMSRNHVSPADDVINDNHGIMSYDVIDVFIC